MPTEGPERSDCEPGFPGSIRLLPIPTVLRDKAEALRRYNVHVGYGLEARNHCAKIKLRAERKAGELLWSAP